MKLSMKLKYGTPELGQEALSMMAMIVAIVAATLGMPSMFLLALSVGLWFGAFALCRRFALRAAEDELSSRPF